MRKKKYVNENASKHLCGRMMEGKSFRKLIKESKIEFTLREIKDVIGFEEFAELSRIN